MACDDAADHLSKTLSDVGFEVIRSFDLQTARRALRDPDGCSCPNHGTSRCDCQYVVLLVSGRASEPVTIVVHGHGDQTLLSLYPQSIGGEAHEIEVAVRRAFESLAAVR
ncbi:MAG: hypothetical protein BMS9Abin28_1643 [Anaerolineae bacterium]|nr:MAG: hypothetical protein BMS9Abin28_1643 [Anaerolineae bacterium]